MKDKGTEEKNFLKPLNKKISHLKNIGTVNEYQKYFSNNRNTFKNKRVADITRKILPTTTVNENNGKLNNKVFI